MIQLSDSFFNLLLSLGYGWIVGHGLFAGFVFLKYSLQPNHRGLTRIAALICAILAWMGLVVLAVALRADLPGPLHKWVSIALGACGAGLVLSIVSYQRRKHWGLIQR